MNLYSCVIPSHNNPSRSIFLLWDDEPQLFQFKQFSRFNSLLETIEWWKRATATPHLHVALIFVFVLLWLHLFQGYSWEKGKRAAMIKANWRLIESSRYLINSQGDEQYFCDALPYFYNLSTGCFCWMNCWTVEFEINGDFIFTDALKSKCSPSTECQLLSGLLVLKTLCRRWRVFHRQSVGEGERKVILFQNF